MAEALIFVGLVMTATCALVGGCVGLLARSRRSLCPWLCLLGGTGAGALAGGLAFASLLSASSFDGLLVLTAAVSGGIGFLCTHFGPTQPSLSTGSALEVQSLAKPEPTKPDVYDVYDEWKTL